MLSMGMTGRMLTNYVGDGRLTKFGVRFTSQVWPGDTLDATATVDAIRKEGGKNFVDLVGHDRESERRRSHQGQRHRARRLTARRCATSERELPEIVERLWVRQGADVLHLASVDDVAHGEFDELAAARSRNVGHRR